MSEQRADIWLVKQGYAPTRSQAKDLIRRGKVLLAGKPLQKAGQMLAAHAEVTLLESHQYVSRSAQKLKGFLEQVNIPLKNRVAVDLGASTGGFTQVLLEAGCARVYAIDVGRDQLVPDLKTDPRVISREGVNARYPLHLPEPTDVVVADLSFISLRLVWETMVTQVGDTGDAFVLIKPQFEAGRGGVNQRGVVSDPQKAQQHVADLLTWGADKGLYTWRCAKASVVGKKGNHEYMAHLRPQPSPSSLASLLKQA